MKKLLILLSVLFFLASCEKSIKNLNKFEIAFTDGKAQKTFILQNGRFEFIKPSEAYGGFFHDEDLKRLQILINEIEKANIKTEIKACSNCPIISIRINRSNGNLNIMQKGDVDDELTNIVKFIDSIVLNKELLKIKPILKRDTGNDVTY